MPLKELKTRSEWDNAGENIPVLHIIGRARNHPSPSPFPIKLETFFRAAQIEYAVDFSQPKSSKGKTPWMTFNKEDIADSQMCIDHVIKVMPDKDLDSHLSDVDRAVVLGFKSLLEDNLYFVFLMKRYAFDQTNFFFENVLAPHRVLYLQNLPTPFYNRLIDQAKGQGIGLHTKEEILEIGHKDLKALSTFLGDKPYLMGENFTTVDCTLFAFICILFYGEREDDVTRVYVEQELPNLKDHMLRVKATYWADWDDCLHKEN